MASLSAWTDAHFSLIQSIGIIATLAFAGIGLYRDAKAKEVDNFLTQTEHHRDLWARILDRKDLERVLRPDIDLAVSPPTPAEIEFLNMVFVCFQNGWRIAKTGGITTLREIEEDIKGTFSLPLPRAVWIGTKKFRNPKFVRFVDKAIEKSSRAS